MKKSLLFTLVIIFITTSCFNASAQTQRKKIDLKAKAYAVKGEDSKIKSDRPTTDAKSRGGGSGTCYVYLHNYTSYSIDIYIDGYWEGTIGAYDDSYVSTGTGYTTVYGISVGKTASWDFDGASCDSYYDYNFYE